jgi:flavin reductase (DIM6/NTAB) family NADH-FMN oxidoreductase RutF
MKKRDFPVERARRFIEPGPVVLISSHYKGQNNIMTCGWHIVLEFSPSLIACYIWDEDYSHEMIRKSKECVINIPEARLAKTVVGIGNTSGADIDKFKTFGLTAKKAAKVKAPLIDECYANLECKLVDTKLIKKYSLFIFEVVKIHTATRPKNPKTIHYRGRGEFMVAGGSLNLARFFKPEMLN